MCGRFGLFSPPEEAANFLGLEEIPDLKPRYNIAPGQPAALVRVSPGGGTRELIRPVWGLRPEWSKPGGSAPRPINARAETAAVKPFFRQALRRRRGIVPADGFYEWKKSVKESRPFFLFRRDEKPLALAGLWERWTGGEDEAVETFVILTTEANEVVQSLHDRMPVIVHRRDFERWLDPDEQDPARIADILKPFPAERMTRRMVGPAVNKVGRDGPECIAPAREEQPSLWPEGEI